MANTISRTQTYQAPDGTTIQIQDQDGNGTFDRVKLSQTDASGQVAHSDWGYMNNEADAQAVFKQLAQDYGLTVKDEGQNEVLAKLTPDQAGSLSSITSAVTAGTASNAQIQGRWADFVSQLSVNGSEDVNALVQEVLRESYTESTQDLSFYAQKVQFYNDLKKKIRDDLSAWRGLLSNHAGDATDAATFNLSNDPNSKNYLQGFDNTSGTGGAYDPTKDPTYSWSGVPSVDADGNLVASKVDDRFKTTGLTKDDVSNHIDDLEESLNSVGDDAQLANVDLQNMLQKQQQTLQMMSNISKMLYDTAMAVVRKISA